MLEELNQRLRELDELNGVRRQSMWQQSSIGSTSSNGSFLYSSPSQPISQGSSTYQQTPPQFLPTPHFGDTAQHSTNRQSSPPRVRQTPSFGESGFTRQISQVSPEQQYHQPTMYLSQPYHAPVGYQFPQPQQPFHFNNRSRQQAHHSIAPIHQFSTWGGYGGPVVDNTLDEENAVPPKTYPWELKQT